MSRLVDGGRECIISSDGWKFDGNNDTWQTSHIRAVTATD